MKKHVKSLVLSLLCLTTTSPVFATATYSAVALADFTFEVISSDAGIFTTADVTQNDALNFGPATSTTLAIADSSVLGVEQAAQVNGGAPPPPPAPSLSQSTVVTDGAIEFTNLSSTDVLEIAFDLVYVASVSASVSDALLEVAGAEAFIELSGADSFLYIASADALQGPGSDGNSGTYSSTLIIDPLESLVLFLEVGAQGFAASSAPVPLPATVLLLCAGMFGFFLQMRRPNA